MIHTLEQIRQLRLLKKCPFRQFHNKNVVYKITNILNKKIYIGISTNLSKRLKSHIYHSQGEGQLAIHRAIKKYGFSCFTFEILNIAKEVNKLDDLEKKEIEKYKANNKKYGYNLNSGGNRFIHNNEIIIKMRKSAQNKVSVYIYDKAGNYLHKYESINDCARALGLKHCSVLSSINKNTLLKGCFVAKTKYKTKIKPHQSGYINTSKKLKGNRNCLTFIWRLEDLKRNKIYETDGIKKLSEKSGYKQDVLRSIAYNRPGYKEYKKYLKITKLSKYD